ncbi:MAG: SRPBCC domain-containing protein [Bdellovibrionota bacterium]
MEQALSHLDKLRTEAALTQDGLIVSQFIPAPRNKVFEAWGSAELMRRWLSPHSCQVINILSEFRVGGKYRSTLICDSETHVRYGVYQAIIQNQKIIFTHQWDEAYPVQTLVKVEFYDRGAGTQVTLQQVGLVGARSTDEHRESWESCLENLAQLLGT